MHLALGADIGSTLMRVISGSIPARGYVIGSQEHCYIPSRMLNRTVYLCNLFIAMSRSEIQTRLLFGFKWNLTATLPQG